MLDVIADHARALDATGRLVATTTSDQLGLDTPDDGWDVRALINHIVAENLWTAELCAGRTIADVGDRFEGDMLGDDYVGAYQSSASAAAAVFAAPGVLDAPIAVSYGPIPGSDFAGHRFLDVLVHGWDLAVATGQDARLDPELVEDCLAVVDPEFDLLAGSGMFGKPVKLGGEADPQTRLLAMLGRGL